MIIFIYIYAVNFISIDKLTSKQLIKQILLHVIINKPWFYFSIYYMVFVTFLFYSFCSK